MAVYSLRPATDEDSHVLFRLHRAALGPYLEEIYGPWDNEVQQRFQDRWLATAHPEVIETSDGVVGVVDFAMTGDHAELSRISIHPDHHNLGLGTAVLTALLKRADEQDLPFIWRLVSNCRTGGHGSDDLAAGLGWHKRSSSGTGRRFPGASAPCLDAGQR